MRDFHLTETIKWPENMVPTEFVTACNCLCEYVLRSCLLRIKLDRPLPSNLTHLILAGIPLWIKVPLVVSASCINTGDLKRADMARNCSYWVGGRLRIESEKYTRLMETSMPRFLIESTQDYCKTGSNHNKFCKLIVEFCWFNLKIFKNYFKKLKI